MAHDKKQHILAGLLIALLIVGMHFGKGVNPLSLKERFGAAAGVAAFLRDGIAQYISGAVAGLEKNCWSVNR